MPWTKWNGTYTQEDVDAFEDPERIDQQFGLPDKRKRVFSVAIHPNGNANPQNRIHFCKSARDSMSQETLAGCLDLG